MKKNVRVIGWLLLLGQLFFQTSAALIAVIVALVNGNFEMGLLIGSDVGSFIANVVILGIFWLVKKKEIKLSEKKTETPWLLIGRAYIIVLLWNCACSFLDTATNHVLYINSDEWSSLSFGFNIITLAIFPAIVEEFAFRKVIFGVLRKYGFPVAAIFSSLCFGLMHQNILQIIFATVLGVVMCYVYEHTGKLYYCMLLHFINNGMSIALTYSEFYRKRGTYIESAIGIIAILVFVIAFIYKKIGFKKLLQINEQYTYTDMIGDIKCCYKRVPMIIYTILCIGIAIVALFI